MKRGTYVIAAIALLLLGLWLRTCSFPGRASLSAGWLWTTVDARLILPWSRKIFVLCDLASALVMFAMVRYWVCRCDSTPARPTLLGKLRARWNGVPIRRTAPAIRKPAPFHGWTIAMVAAGMAWLNPVCMISTDAARWALPFVLLAMWGGLIERWLLAGMSLAMACAIDWHVLQIAAVFVLWPIFSFAPRALFKIVIGFICASSTLMATHLLSNESAVLWVVGLSLVPVILKTRWFGKGPLASAVVGIPIAMELIAWPMIFRQHWHWKSIGVVGLIAVLLPWYCRRLSARWFACQVALAIATGLLAAPILFGGSFAWIWQPITSDVESLIGIGAVLSKWTGLSPGEVVFQIDLPAINLCRAILVEDILLLAHGLGLCVTGAVLAWTTSWPTRGALLAMGLPMLGSAALISNEPVGMMAMAAIASAMLLAGGFGPTLAQLLLTTGATLLVLRQRCNDDANLAQLVKAHATVWPVIILLAMGSILMQAICANNRPKAI